MKNNEESFSFDIPNSSQMLIFFGGGANQKGTNMDMNIFLLLKYVFLVFSLLYPVFLN